MPSNVICLPIKVQFVQNKVLGRQNIKERRISLNGAVGKTALLN